MLDILRNILNRGSEEDREMVVSETDEEGFETVSAGAYPRDVMDSTTDSISIGYTETDGITPFDVSHSDLYQNMALFGQTGYGKSTVLRNTMYQVMRQDNGFCFIDRKGQDVTDLLQVVPENRLEDIVWVEPGEGDSGIKNNFFETYYDPEDEEYEAEVEHLVSNFVSLVADGHGKRVESVTESIARKLIKADESYTPVEFYKIISIQEEREKFAEMFDDFEKPVLEHMDSMKQVQHTKFQGDLKTFMEEEEILSLFANRDSSVNISEAVMDGKIVLVKLSHIEDSTIQKLVSAVITRQIWSAIQVRMELESDVYDPYFLCIDEFAKVESSAMGIEDILPESRSLQLSVILASQQITQLRSESQASIKSNCKNIFSFRVGRNVEDADELSSIFYDIEGDDLLNLPAYVVFGNKFMDDGTVNSVRIQTFAPYPAVREYDSVDEVIRNSVDRYSGPISIDDIDWSEYQL